jgi:hypothetical protein
MKDLIKLLHKLKNVIFIRVISERNHHKILKCKFSKDTPKLMVFSYAHINYKEIKSFKQQKNSSSLYIHELYIFLVLTNRSIVM